MNLRIAKRHAEAPVLPSLFLWDTCDIRMSTSESNIDNCADDTDSHDSMLSDTSDDIDTAEEA